MSDVIDKIIKSSFELLLDTFFYFKILCLKKKKFLVGYEFTGC